MIINTKKIKVISCITTLLIMALIFWFSSQNSVDSSATSKGFSMWLLSIVKPQLLYAERAELAADMSHMIRKFAHFSMYAALGMSSAAAVSSISGKPVRKILMLSVLFCAAYAVTDEIHQMFVGGRAGMVGDVLIDTAGAATGGVLMMLAISIIRYIRKKKVNE